MCQFVTLNYNLSRSISKLKPYMGRCQLGGKLCHCVYFLILQENMVLSGKKVSDFFFICGQYTAQFIFIIHDLLSTKERNVLVWCLFSKFSFVSLNRNVPLYVIQIFTMYAFNNH